jgi:hydroxypyruvate isomerase
MNRKEFLNNGMILGAGLSMPKTFTSPKDVKVQSPFTMKFSPDFNIFTSAAPKDSVDHLKWGYDHGFRAWESTWLRRRPVAEQERISKAIQQLGMEFGQFVGTTSPDPFKEVTFAGRNKDVREKVLENLRESVEVAKRMNSKFVHNVLGIADYHLPWDLQMANAIELLKRAAEIYEPHGITMIMETMNQRSQPGLFLYNIPQAYAMAKAVDSPSVKILFDIFHVQKQTGNLTDLMDYTWDEIAYFQIGDAPGRYEPGTGEINFKFLFQHIYDKGYRGFAGLEHKISASGSTGDLAALKAYREVDPSS